MMCDFCFDLVDKVYEIEYQCPYCLRVIRLRYCKRCLLRLLSDVYQKAVELKDEEVKSEVDRIKKLFNEFYKK